MLHDADALMVFHSLAAIKLGNGNDVLFWLDRWVNGVSILDLAPSVFWAVPKRVRNRRTVAEGLLDSSWVADVSSPLDVQGIAESVRLWLAINNVVRDATIPDSFSWPCAANGVYSAKDTYIALCQGNIRSATASCTWKAWAPLKCRLFIWLALQYRVWTSDRRVRHGLQEAMVPCYVCLQEEDTLDHIIMGCVVAREVWFRCFRCAGVQVDIPDGTEKLECWWLKARKKFRGKDKRLFDTLVVLIGWSLWKHRNAYIFNNVSSQCTAVDLVARIVGEFNDWMRARGGAGVGVLLVRE
jgi:hypothetical protein